MTEKVLVKCRSYPPYGVYHERDPDNPDRPKCDHDGRKDVEFRSVEKKAVPTHRVCKECAGTVEQEKQTGQRPSTLLKNIGPDGKTHEPVCPSCGDDTYRSRYQGKKTLYRCGCEECNLFRTPIARDMQELRRVAFIFDTEDYSTSQKPKVEA